VSQDRGRGTPAAGRFLGERQRLGTCRGHQLFPGPLRPAQLASGLVGRHGRQVRREGYLAKSQDLALDDVTGHDQLHWLGVGHGFAVPAQESDPFEYRRPSRLRGLVRGGCDRGATRQAWDIDPGLAVLRTGLEIEIEAHLATGPGLSPAARTRDRAPRPRPGA
jgi:hypothetical protein